jgi:hypothetical protein
MVFLLALQASEEALKLAHRGIVGARLRATGIFSEMICETRYRSVLSNAVTSRMNSGI